MSGNIIFWFLAAVWIFFNIIGLMIFLAIFIKGLIED